MNGTEVDILYFKMLMLQAEIEMNAMIAENSQRAFLGRAMAYVEKDFMELIDKYQIHDNSYKYYMLTRKKEAD